jgi:hypothetical protein
VFSTTTISSGGGSGAEVSAQETRLARPKPTAIDDMILHVGMPER